jgi:hypothetical protein
MLAIRLKCSHVAILIAIALLAIPVTASSGNLLFMDAFANGKPQLRWAPYPYFNLDNLQGLKTSAAPDADNGIGVLRNGNAGGFASLSYAVTRQVAVFHLESMVYCPVTEGAKGPLTGIAFLIDPIGCRFYRFVSDFNNNAPTLNIAYVGQDTRNFPVYLKFWDATEIPGGVPGESGWHKMAVSVKDGILTAYWDGRELNGGPFFVDRIARGFMGVYTNYVGGLGEAATKVDSFILKPK